MTKPVIVAMSYPADCLKDWSSKNCRMLASSGASDYLKRILTGKVGRRNGGRRFFGEAYVAAQIDHRHGYYASFKWLTNSRFCDDRPFPKGPTKEFKEKFRAALLKHFGERQLKRLAKRARDVENATGVQPVAPDLWLIDRHGNHRFIEVKLPGDRIHPEQLKGMALIASCLRANTRLTVEIVELRPEDRRTSHAFSTAPNLMDGPKKRSPP